MLILIGWIAVLQAAGAWLGGRLRRTEKRNPDVAVGRCAGGGLLSAVLGVVLVLGGGAAAGRIDAAECRRLR